MAFATNVNRKVLKASERIAGDLAVVMQETDAQGTHNGAPVHIIGTEDRRPREEGRRLGHHPFPLVVAESKVTKKRRQVPRSTLKFQAVWSVRALSAVVAATVAARAVCFASLV